MKMGIILFNNDVCDLLTDSKWKRLTYRVLHFKNVFEPGFAHVFALLQIFVFDAKRGKTLFQWLENHCIFVCGVLTNGVFVQTDCGTMVVLWWISTIIRLGDHQSAREKENMAILR